MYLGVSRDRNLEIRDFFESGDEIGGKTVAARMRLVGRPQRRVAAQSDDMAHAGIPVAAGDLVHLVAGRPDAGQMGCRDQLPLTCDSGNRGMGAGLG